MWRSLGAVVVLVVAGLACGAEDPGLEAAPAQAAQPVAEAPEEAPQPAKVRGDDMLCEAGQVKCADYNLWECVQGQWAVLISECECSKEGVFKSGAKNGPKCMNGM